MNRATRLLCAVCCLCLCSAAHAQWSVSGVKIFYTSGQVGIGTNSPQYMLDVRSAGSRAISGMTTAGSGVSYGIYGQSNSTTGRGVYGLANSSSGTNYGVYGRTRSNNGYAGYFVGGRNYFQGNVGIGTNNPKSALHVSTSGQKYAAQIINGSTNGKGVLIRGGANDNSTPLLSVQTAAGAQRLEVTSDGVTKIKTLTILGGSDLAEPFVITPPPQRAALMGATDADHDNRGDDDDDDADNAGNDNADAHASVQPGMVVCIDPNTTGSLMLSSQPYDRRVAGIISGANELSPGMVMKSQGDPHVDGNYPVALTGRVWCWCDATSATGNGPIEPGDMLTTSATLGHAMKVADFDRAHGAVIGKAMSKLERGRGLVLVLVNLQ